MEPGEQLRNIAFGVKQPNLLLMPPLFALAVLPGAIAVALLTKEYVVVLTDRRLMVLRFKGKNVSMQEVLDYRLNGQLPALLPRSAMRSKETAILKRWYHLAGDHICRSQPSGSPPRHTNRQRRQLFNVAVNID